MRLELHRGRDFHRTAVEKSAHRRITLQVYAAGILVGGMTYYLDPALHKPHNSRPARTGTGPTANCASLAGDLLKCLKLPADDVKCVKVKKVVLEVELP